MQIRNMLILFKNNLFKKNIFIFWHNISVHILQVKCTIFLNQHIILIFNTLHDKISTNKLWPVKGWFCSYCNSNRSSKYTKFLICESRLILPCSNTGCRMILYGGGKVKTLHLNLYCNLMAGQPGSPDF